jgi:OmpA-OmpF porin, OOP family
MKEITHMKFIKASGILACAVAAAMTSSVTFAIDDAGWYLGGNVGQSRARLDEYAILSQVAPGLSPTIVRDNTIDGGAGKLFGGYQINRYLSLEAGYFNLEEFQFYATTRPAGAIHTNMQVRGVNLDVVGYAPLTENLSAFARLGVTRALTQNTFDASGAAAGMKGKLSDRDTFPKAGVGLEYKFTDSFSMRAEAERYRISNAVGDHNNIDLYSVGVVYRFGAKPAPAPVVKALPPAPTPAPVVVAPPAPRFEKYTLSSTELFGFDSVKLSLSQPKLDEIAAALKTDGGPTQIVIVGHTDRLGSDEYNQKLSERRAEAVKSYIANKGVDPSRLQVVGKGESEPVVQCTETKKAALIECLKPNRRVEIDQVVVERKVNP